MYNDFIYTKLQTGKLTFNITTGFGLIKNDK